MMRLDKFLSVTATATRKETARAVRCGGVTVNGIAVQSPSLGVDPEADEVVYFGEPVVYRKFTYIMLNKPEGVVSATEDGQDRTVLDLLPDKLRKLDLFPCGRLDKYTVGLVLLTDNGPLGHTLLAPKSHVSKTYSFTTRDPLSDENVYALEKGVYIAGGYLTKPCRISLSQDRKSGKITITEGKYHQIRLMAEAVKNKILFLERVSFGPLVLDANLERGQWRFLTPEETAALESLGIPQNDDLNEI